MRKRLFVTLLLLVLMAGAVGSPGTAAESVRTAPFDAGEVCYIYGDKLPPEGPSDSYVARCARYPLQYRDLGTYASNSLAAGAWQGVLTAGGWDYLYLPDVRQGFLASVQRASTTAYHTSLSPGTITVKADLAGLVAGTPSSFVRRLHLSWYPRPERC